MEGDGVNIMGEIANLVKNQGVRVEKGSEYCKRHVATHESCFGCESEKGCKAVVEIGLVMMYPILYKPTNFEDFLKQEKYVQEKLKAILDNCKPGL